MVREAGGFVTDLDGGDAMFDKKHVLAGNETIHRELQTVAEGRRLAMVIRNSHGAGLFQRHLR